MLYLIDAYNLIGKIDKISFSDPEKEDKLIEFILNRGVLDKDKFIVAFDGKRDLSPGVTKEQRGCFTLVFTELGQSADAYIIDYIRKASHKAKVIIVSSDNEILLAAKHKGLRSLKSEQFLAAYHNRQSIENKPDVSDSDTEFWLNKFS